MKPSQVKIAVMIARLGPYHVARMRALGQAVGPEQTLALEIAAENREYAWAPVATDGFRRLTLITDADYQDTTARLRATRTVEALDQTDPAYVAISGWGFPEARAAVAWCRRNGRVAIVMSESQERDEPRFRIKEIVKQQVVQAFDSALVSSGSHARYLERLGMGADRIARGYDVVDNEHFRKGAELARADAEALRAKFKLPERYFLCSARFIEKKNLARLLEAFAQYRAGNPAEPWDLVLMGDGPLRAELEAKRAALGLQSTAHFPGFKQYDDLPTFYGLASAFILPSTSEQWGLVVNEAMAAGLPVLVSNACGAAEELVVEGQNGFTFDPLDVRGLAELLTRMSAPSTDRAAMIRRSTEIVARWAPGRFGAGMVEAMKMGDRHRDQRRPELIPNVFLWV